LEKLVFSQINRIAVKKTMFVGQIALKSLVLCLATVRLANIVVVKNVP
jgi:hypothetical protein